MAHKIAILGATGNIGVPLVTKLLEKGHAVKAIARNQKKLEKLKEKGAEVISLDISDVEGLMKAFEGVDAVFSFTPPFYATEAIQNKITDSIAEAIQKAKVPYVVNLSSLGAQFPEGTGPIVNLYRHEQMLNKISDLNVVHLRAGYFMENLFLSIPLIKLQGSFGSTEDGLLPLDMINTKDVADKVAQLLDGLAFKNRSVIDYVGPRAVTLNEAAGIIGRAIGIPNLRYIQFPLNDAKKAMQTCGLSTETAEVMIEMERAINEGKFAPTQEIKPENRGSRTIEDFVVSEFAPLYSNTGKETVKS